MVEDQRQRVDEERLCPYCDGAHRLEICDTAVTCGDGLCENVYWDELNAETLRGG